MSYLKKYLMNKNWWACAGVRALKTLAQTAIATIGSAALISSVDWKVVISASVLAGALSILTSIAGLPEVEVEEEIETEEEKGENGENAAE